MNDQTTDPQSQDAPEIIDGEAPRRSSNGWFWILFVLMVVAGAAAVTWPVWSPMAPPWVQTFVADLQGKKIVTDPAFETAPLSAPGAADVMPEIPVEAPVATPVEVAPTEVSPVVEAPVATVTPAPVVEPVVDSSARLDALEARVNAIAAGGTRDAADLAETLSAQLAAANVRINALEAQIAELASRQMSDPNANSQALILAVTQVQAALDREKPYANALGALKAIATQDAHVASALVVLTPHAEDGLPSAGTLAADFDGIGTQAIRAKGRDSAEPSTLSERFMDGVKGLVTVRRTDGSTGDPVDDAIAGATTALKVGDLAAAVAALEHLSGGPKAAVDDWSRLAQARVAADQAMERLQAHALAVLAGAN